MRPLTLLSAILFVLSGAYLFAVKHRSQVLEDQIAQYRRETTLDAQRISVLQAQWALEAAPSRLQALASQFTHLQPMQPAQLVTLAALQAALPAPGSAVPAANPAGAAPPLPVVVSQAAPVPAPVPPRLTPAPLRLASVTAAPRHIRHDSAPREFAEVHASPRGGSALARMGGSALAPVGGSALAPVGGSALAPVAMAASQPLLGAQVVNVRAVSTEPAPQDGGSLLGMAQDSQGSAN
jgi:hypothetical protein